jgi:hypothetical protein
VQSPVAAVTAAGVNEYYGGDYLSACILARQEFIGKNPNGASGRKLSCARVSMAGKSNNAQLR